MRTRKSIWVEGRGTPKTDHIIGIGGINCSDYGDYLRPDLWYIQIYIKMRLQSRASRQLTPETLWGKG